MSATLPPCLLYGLPVCYTVSLPAPYLPTCSTVSLPAPLSPYLLHCLPTCSTVSLPAPLSSYLLHCLPTCSTVSLIAPLSLIRTTRYTQCLLVTLPYWQGEKWLGLVGVGCAYLSGMPILNNIESIRVAEGLTA
jgi:hypothetical protein